MQKAEQYIPFLEARIGMSLAPLDPRELWEVSDQALGFGDQRRLLEDIQTSRGFGLDTEGNVISDRQKARWWAPIHGVVAIPHQDRLAVYLVRVVGNEPGEQEQVELMDLRGLLEYRSLRSAYVEALADYLSGDNTRKSKDPTAPIPPKAPPWLLLRLAYPYKPIDFAQMDKMTSANMAKKRKPKTVDKVQDEPYEPRWTNQMMVNGPEDKSLISLSASGSPYEQTAFRRLCQIVAISHFRS